MKQKYESAGEKVQTLLKSSTTRNSRMNTASKRKLKKSKLKPSVSTSQAVQCEYLSIQKRNCCENMCSECGVERRLRNSECALQNSS